MEKVAPLVGAWIEIQTASGSTAVARVAPLVGAWIEMLYLDDTAKSLKSLLSWERGLKYGIKAVTKSVGNGRSSRGSVD